MGLLDEALGGNALPNLDQLTFKTGDALSNIGAKAAELSKPRVTSSVSVQNTPQEGWANETITQNQEKLSYLDYQINEANKRSSRFEESVVSDDNLNSSNPFTYLGSNALNLGARALSGLGNAATGLIDGVLSNAIVNEEQRIPKEIFELGERQRLAGELPNITKDIQRIENQLKYGNLTENQRNKLSNDLNIRSKELELAKRPLTAEETSFLTEDSDDAYEATREKNWQSFFDTRNKFKDYRKAVVGDPDNDQSSLIGSENLGNDLSTRNFQAMKDRNQTAGKSFWEQVKGNAGDVVRNPSVALDTLAESAVYMNPYTRGLGMAGTFGRSSGEGLENLRKGGEQVSDAEQLVVGGIATGAATLDYLGGKVLGSAAGGNFAKGIGNKAGNVTKSVIGKINNASRATVGQLGTVGNLAHKAGSALNLAIGVASPVVTRTGLAGLTEGGIEVAQNAFEQGNSKLYRKSDDSLGINYDVDEAADSFLLGAAAGGYASAPANTLQAGMNALGTGMKARTEQRFGNSDVTIEQLLDPKESTFNPLQAMARSVESVKGVMPGDAEFEAKYQAAKTSADAAYKAASDAVANTQGTFDRLDKLDEMKQKMATVEQLIAGLDSSGLDPEQVAQQRPIYEGLLSTGNAMIASVESALADREGFEKLHEKNLKALQDTETAYNKFVGSYNTHFKKEEAEDPNAPPEENEANKLLGAPSFGNVGRMQALINSDAVSELVKDKLRVVSDALVAENAAKTLGKINNSVEVGSKGYRGMSQYIQQMQKAVAGNDPIQQQVLTKQLNNFIDNLTSKHEAATQAMALANSRYAEDPMGRPRDAQVQIVRDGSSNNWRVVEGKPYSTSALKKNNGLTFSPERDNSIGSKNLVDAIGTNLDAALKTRTAMQAISNMDPQANTQEAPIDIDADLDSFQQALDALNADERVNGRDTTARDTDPGVRKVSISESARDGSKGSAEAPRVQVGQDPESFTNHNAQAYREVADKRGLTTELEDLAAQGLTARQIRDTLKTAGKLDFLEVTEQDNFVVGVRASLGIPSRSTVEGEQEYATWLEGYNQRKGTQPEDEPEAMTKAEAESAAKAASKATGKKFKAKAVVGGYDIEEVTSEPKAKPKSEEPKAEPTKRKATKPEKAKAKVEESVEQELVPNNEVYEEQDSESTDVDQSTNSKGKVDSSPKGAIDVLDTQGKSYKETIAEEKAKEPKAQNYVKASFVQRLRGGLNSPLVSTKNLLSTLLTNRDVKDLFAKFIMKNSNISNPTQAQVDLVTDFANFAYKLSPVISDTIRAKANPDYYHESIVDYLLTENDQGQKELDENIHTAIALGAYDWLATNGNNVIGSMQDIANKVWMPEAKVLPDSAYDLLVDVGTYRDEVIKSMGQKAMASLQLKQLNSADMEATNKLTMALGALALASLSNAGFVQTTEVSVKLLNEIKTEIKESNPDEYFKTQDRKIGDKEIMAFIRPAVKMDGPNIVFAEGSPVLHNRIKTIVALNKEASTVLSNVFGYTSDTKMPSAEPVKSVPQSFDDLGSKVTKLQKEVILKSQSQAYSIDSGMMDLFAKFRDNAFDLTKKMFGVRDENNVLTIRKASVRSSNEEIERSFYNLEMVFSEFGDTEMYLENTIWSNMRSGIANVFNPQANRVHRAFSSLNSDIISVPHNVTDVYDAEGKLTKYGMFLRGLGYRMEDAKGMTVNGELAKNYGSDWLPAFEDYVNSDEVTQAAQSLNNVKQGTAQKADFDKVANLIIKWGNGEDGLSVLNAIAARNEGRKTGTDYESRIPVESDGSNNGPAFTQTLMNTGTTEIMNSVGVYFNDQSIEDMVSYRDPKGHKGKDMYEQLAVIKDKLLKVLVGQFEDVAKDTNASEQVRKHAQSSLRTLNAIEFLDKAFTSRKGAKRDLVPFNYGAGMAAVKRGASRAFFESILDAYEIAVVDGNTQAIADITYNTNLVIHDHNIRTGSRVAYLDAKNMNTLDLKITEAQKKAIRETEQTLRGDVTERALQEYLADYITSREAVTTMANSAYTLFKPLYDTVMAKTLEEYYAANPEAKRTNQNIPKEVHAKVMQNLCKYMPRLDVAMGLHNTEFNLTAIPVMGTTKKWSDKQLNVPYIRTQSTSTIKRMMGGETYLNPTKTGNATMSVGIETMDLDAPGVSALAKYIQSHDAYVNFRVMEKFAVQNYHDASPVNPYQADELARYQNEAFLDAVSISHIGEAFVNALLAPLKAYTDGTLPLSDKANLDAFNSAIGKLRKSFEISESTSDKDVVMMIAKQKLSSDIAKMRNLVMNVNSINQYATEGGNYVIDSAKRAELVKRQNELESRAAKIEKRIEDMFSNISGTKPTKVAPVKAEQTVKREQAAEQKETGKVFKTDFEKAIWNDREKLSDPKELIKYVHQNLSKHLAKDDAVGKFSNIYAELLKLGRTNLMDLDVNIFFDADINAGNKPLAYDEALSKGLHAWYKADGNKRQINIRLGSNEKIDTKVIVHELIHAATADAIYHIGSERKQKGIKSVYSKSANNAYDNLVSNYENVKNYAEANINLETNPLIEYGISNLDEFIATALTYPKFGEFLNNIKVNTAPNARIKPKQGSMFRNIMENLVGLFKGVYGGGTPKAKDVSALEALVIDVSKFVEQTTSLEANNAGGSLLGAPAASGMDTVNEMSAKDVLNALPSTGNTELDTTLDKLMDSVTDKVLNKLPKDYKGKNTFSPENIWNNALDIGEAPYQTEAVKQGFNLSAREQFALEATELAVEVTLKDKGLSDMYSEITHIYEATRSNTKVEDMHDGEWANATSEEKAIAAQKYDYLFGSNKSALPRFIAMSLTTAEVAKLTKFDLDPNKRNESDNEYFEKVYNYVDSALDRVMNHVLGTNSRKADIRLDAITRKFVDIDNKQRNNVLQGIEAVSGLVDHQLNRAVKVVADKVADVAASTSPENRAAQTLRNLTITTLTGKPFAAFDLLNEFRNKSNQNETLGFLGELGKEIGNPSEQQRVGEKLIMQQKQHENEAQRLRTSMKQDLITLFKDKGAYLTKDMREAIGNVVLRTDMQSLVQSYSLAQIKDLLSNRQVLNKEIKAKKQGITAMHNYRAKMLAWYMVSNQGNKLLAKSALAIASGVGLTDRTEPTEEYVQQLDELVSLYALRYSDRQAVDHVVSVMDAENNAGGFEAVLKFHRGLAHDSKQALFSGAAFNYTKGYMPEVTNPSKRLVVAESPQAVENYRAAMFTELGEVPTDALDPSTFKPIMFFTEDAAHQDYLSGAMPLSSSGAKGTKLNLDPKDIIDIMNVVRAEDIDEDFDPRASTGGSMIPVYDLEGNVVDMRYEMTSFRRNTLLERKNDFTDLLSTFNAVGYTKVANEAQTQHVVDELFNDYKNNKGKDLNKYVYVSYESTDPVAYEAWSRLSNSTKEYVKDVWGEYGMWVSNDAFLTVFGYPKISLATAAFDKDMNMRNFAEEMYVTMMKTVFRGNARVYAARTEKMWQEMVALSKSFIVIRNASTLFMNIMSNSFLLMAHGVSMADIISNTRDSIRGGMQYRKDVANITKLEARQRAGIGDANDLQRQIDSLRERMNRNPMQEFIDKGMFAGIVEDIDPSQDMYSYQSGLQRKLDDTYNKIPKPVRTVAEYAFVTPSTPLYQFLHSATQYSDFSAKYVLYKHLTERRGKSEDYALFEAQDNFINYDVPTSPWLQYANDMGLVMFTKYNLRIQKALFKLIAERPASAIGQAIMMQGVTSLPPGIDPIVFAQYGNPFRDGAFGLLDTWDEPFPIKALF